MNSKVLDTALSIAAVERDTGLGKDTLRVWERRYGFPSPLRDSNGERLYSMQQVERLRLIKRLMDHGHRPGKLVPASDEELQRLCEVCEPPRAAATGGPVRDVLGLLRGNDVAALRLTLNQMMLRQGMQDFVLNTVPELNREVGDAWMRGELHIFEEHLYTEQIGMVLRQGIVNLPSGAGSPRILLTTVPEEQHGLGLLMAEALLALEGACCVSLGTQTPLADIRMAALSHGADIVALSFSAVYPARRIAPLLAELRGMLPEHIDIWSGGAGSARVNAADGIVPLLDMPSALIALATWRARRASL
ncbi:MerR family transcriptional regulator [Noviherbaspirillum pedocola]|uniref:MerR family transcriptional regulator n=1 Tax=Noviherbaspirillum pedocola TaxID=2801341 RepID=A0A934SNG5_9BURK|nr:MerR family transcriptional regulator [Noviherbaspirillum pedocola]MBK4733680.1 MerR family transcriptional regulator [Noviherbaspirillum pedocola]